MPSKKIIQAAALFEKWILSLVYLYFAWMILYGKNDLDILNRSGFWTPPLSGMSKQDFVFVIQDTLLFVIQFSIGVILLTGRKPAEQFRTWREIFVPLLAAFFFITYDYINQFPTWFHTPLLHDESLQVLLAKAGLVVGAVGSAISAWGMWSLGRSFGILVSVRKVVLGGPYRYVRHPIYLGYFFLFGGVVLAYPAPAYFILFPIHFSIMAWRAKLEEARLSSFSPEYKANMARTGFFFPKLWPARKTAPKP
jgi:protein-S-isoprenylcysteine O-methyltransferase Ste14